MSINYNKSGSAQLESKLESSIQSSQTQKLIKDVIKPVFDDMLIASGITDMDKDVYDILNILCVSELL
jgi:hypothetical protein